MTLDVLLSRTMTHDFQDTALLSQLADLPTFNSQALKARLPHWTPEEQDENKRLWREHEYDTKTRGYRR